MENTIKRAQNPKRLFYDIILSVLIPSFLLTRGEDFIDIDPVTLFFIALAFPTIYGLYDFIFNKYFNIISVLGFINTLLSGAVVIFELGKTFIVLKEAGFPLLIGLLLLYYKKSTTEFIRVITDDILDKKKILEKISENKLKKWYEQIAIRFIYPFFLSAILNFIITYIIIQSPVGTPEFNEEMGQLIVWGFIGIALPATIAIIIILFLGFKKLKLITKLEIDDILLSEEEIKKNQERNKKLG